MDNYKKYIIGASLLLLVSCSNMSDISKTQLISANKSGYSKQANRQEKEGVSLISFAEFPGDIENTIPEKLTWDILKDAKFEMRYNKEYDMEVSYPVFGKTVKKYNGKELYITGYIIPIKLEEGVYALSKFNNASCFFCGRSGPETVISLKFKTKPRRYKTDEYLTMKGKLELNGTNNLDFMYIFRDAEEFTVPK